MVLKVRHMGGTCEVVDDTVSGAPVRVEGPFTSDRLADRWIEEQGPRYEAMRRSELARQETSAKQQEEGSE